MNYHEINFDGLVGPTHNYAGLSYGNIASTSNQSLVANPRKAALQGLLKAKTLADWGFPQAILPPHERPSIQALKGWGIRGNSDSDILARASREAPLLLAAASSASSMWTANACTMAPSCDAADKRAHFTPANLCSNLHRSMESPFTGQLLRTIFDDEANFVVHPPLAGGSAMSDEGAANHIRLCPEHGKPGLHVFLYGKDSLAHDPQGPSRFPARQSLQSVQAIARLHQLGAAQVLCIRQSAEAIDAGVFHNDVISVGHRDVLLYHEQAFAGGPGDVQSIAHAFLALTGRRLRLIEVKKSQLSLSEAVSTYLFNSQLLSMDRRGLLLAVPAECLENSKVADLLSGWVEDRHNPVSEIVSFNLRESMRNGGGPACLRQRVVLSERERHHLRGRLILDQKLYGELVHWVERHYRSQLHPDALADPQLLEESRNSLDELTGILGLPSIYPFQL